MESEHGAGPVILDTMCSKGWTPFLQTATRGTQIHPIKTFWRGGKKRTCPDHAFVHSTSQHLLIPSGAYVMEGLSELSDGHHILGVALHVVDGPIPASMQIPNTTMSISASPPPDHAHQKTSSGIEPSSWAGSGRNPRWIMITSQMKRQKRPNKL